MKKTRVLTDYLTRLWRQTAVNVTGLIGLVVMAIIDIFF